MALATKPSFLCEESVILCGLPFEFVSRGGFKLQKALEEFSIDLNGKTVLDIGASTGGFTDVCLQNGAKKVYAVDTGEGQLAEKVKCDKRVVNLENTNYLALEGNFLKEIDFVCIDVSFVSLKKLAAKLAKDFGKSSCSLSEICHSKPPMDSTCQKSSLALAQDEIKEIKNIDIVALIKPQFECGLEYARKHKGVVKDEKMHKKLVQEVTTCFEKHGFNRNGLITSPIKGGDGNTEFLLWLKNY